MDLRGYLGRQVKIFIDYQLGTNHLQDRDIWYPVNYGHICGLVGDNSEHEAYLLGVYEPVTEADGVIIGYLIREGSNTDRLIIAPEGQCFSEEQIRALVAFQERFFFTKLVVYNCNEKTRFKLTAAVHLFIIRGRQILLSRRFNTGYEDGYYSVIAGHLDGNEDLKAATIREAQEEAGIQVAPIDLEVIGVMHRKSNYELVDFFLVTRHWSGEIVNTEPHLCDELNWFDLNSLPSNMVPYVRKALENYRRGIWFDSLGWEEQGSSR